MTNLFAYGLRLRLDGSLFPNVYHNLLVTNNDDVITWLSVPGCALFTTASLLIEWLGLLLVRREQQVSGRDSPGGGGQAAAAEPALGIKPQGSGSSLLLVICCCLSSCLVSECNSQLCNGLGAGCGAGMYPGFMVVYSEVIRIS
jgi:hypothetical protein